MTNEERAEKLTEILDDAVGDTRLSTGQALEAVAESPVLLQQWADMYGRTVTDDFRLGVLMAARMVLDYPAEELAVAYPAEDIT